MDERKRMGLDELSQLPEFQRLTQKQQLWISTYVAGGLLDGKYDSISSTQTAYNCASQEIARIMSYSMMQNIRIIAVLNRHFQTTPIERFLVQIDRAIQNKKLTVAQIGALRLKCDVLKLENRLPARAPMVAALKAPKKPRKEKRKPAERPAQPEAQSPYIDF